MAHAHRHQTTLLWTAISVGWTFLALVLGVLSEARWGTKAAFERVFLVLAVAGGTIALWRMGARCDGGHLAWIESRSRKYSARRNVHGMTSEPGTPQTRTSLLSGGQAGGS